MESPVVFVLILAATNFAAAANIPQIYASMNPLPVGNNVTLFSQLPITTGAWMFNNQIIVMIFPGGQIITNTWSNRVTFNSTTSSLTIMSLQLEDSGVYTLQSVNNFLAQLTLSVQVPISNVTLRANATNLVEFNDTAVLMCSVLYGSSLSYVWLNGSSVVTTGGMVQLSNGGATLTIVSVTRYDQGPFRCNVSNGVSQEVSLPVLLNISYGPSNTTMTIMPMRSTYITGSNITLSCSADSIPPAIIQWMVDGMYLNQSGPQLQLQMVKESNSGNYQCLFYNTVTLLFSSKSAMINILEPIVAVVVNHTGGPVILHERLILHCEVTGVVASIQWWRNGHLITADNTTEINNKTLIILSVQLSDNGNYQCQAFNSVSNMTSSPYTVQVNYGPQKPTIMGPNMTKTGVNATFSCYASSNPTSSYKWFFNDSLVANTSEYVTPLLTKEMSGTYTCMAFNNITGKNSTAYKMLTVLAPVTMASIKIVGAQPILNHTFTLTCEASGDVDFIIWMYDWSQLYADNTRNFSMDQATLTFDPVMNSDNGNYQCIASNALSSSSSQNFTLEVFYGPQMPTIMGPNMAKTGVNATFSCYASSNPTSSYKWFFNDSLVANTSEYVTPLLTKEMSGTYTCMAFNNITGKNSTAYTMLTVLAPVTMASIKIVGAQPIQNHTFALTCEASGDVDFIIWMYDWSQLYADNTRNFSMDQATLTFDPVMNSDNGNYQCIASNPFSSSSSQNFTLEVFYGPQMPTIMGPNMAKTGDNATFSCYASSNPTSSYKWFFNDSLVANTSEYVTPLLTKEMSGTYTCMAFNNITGKNSTAYTMLTVLAPVTMASIKIVGAQPIQNHTFTLTCEASGDVDFIIWMYDWSQLYADNTRNFSMDQATLTFDPVMNSDNGNYQCIASNALSSSSSQNFTLEVFYGPQMPTIMGPNMTKTGVNATFSCYASSNPTSSYKWFFNDSLVANTSEYVTPLLTKEMSGTYTCMAFNNITGKNSSAYTMLTVLAPVTMASIKIVGAQPILNHTFTLTCEASGDVDFIIWMYDWSQLYADNTRNFSMDQATLTFDPVMNSDNGNYQCIASNPFSSSSSQNFTLEVFYGPQMPTIMGPNMAKTGVNATFSCYASSNPTSSYKWFFNDSLVANTSEYVTPLLTKEMSGTYTCMAFNNITGKNSTAYTMLTVFDHLKYVHVETPMTPAIAGNSYNLMCNVSGPAGDVYWMKNGEPLHEDNRTVFSMDKKTVTFNPLGQNDTGLYQCMVINAGWNMTSAPYMLIVNFGPEKPMIEGPAFAETGHNASFQCSAMSVPPSQFSWWFNGSKVSNTSMFKTDLLSLNMSGEYTCMAYNYITKKNSTNSKMLTVVEPIESVMIRNNTVPINSKNFTLTCDVTGPYDMIYWMKDNMNLNMTNLTSTPHMSYHIKNNMLHFTPLTMYSDGTYQCVATNHAGPHKSPQYTLLVNYGPLSVNISGPGSAKVNLQVSLNCSAVSRPDCNFQWFFNNNSMALNTGSVITFLANKGTEGSYMCKATNPVTNITMYQTKAFTLTAHASALHFTSQGGLMLMSLFALSVPVLFS